MTIDEKVVAYMRRTITYQAFRGHYDGERIITEKRVFDDDIPLIPQSAYAELAADRDSLRSAGLYTANRLAEAESQLAELQATLQGIADADYRKWDDGINTPFAFVDWAKSRAKHALGATNKGQDNG